MNWNQTNWLVSVILLQILRLQIFLASLSVLQIWLSSFVVFHSKVTLVNKWGHFHIILHIQMEIIYNSNMQKISRTSTIFIPDFFYSFKKTIFTLLFTWKSWQSILLMQRVLCGLANKLISWNSGKQTKLWVYKTHNASSKHVL